MRVPPRLLQEYPLTSLLDSSRSQRRNWRHGLRSHDVTPCSVIDRPRQAGWGLPGSRPRLASLPHRHVRARTRPSRQRLLPAHPEAWGRAVQSPEAKAQSSHREAASSSAPAPARPTGFELKPQSLTASRIQDSAEAGGSPLCGPGYDQCLCLTGRPAGMISWATERSLRGWSIGG
jgi:hypothetical protein